jgi:hypothetical protein
MRILVQGSLILAVAAVVRAPSARVRGSETASLQTPLNVESPLVTPAPPVPAPRTDAVVFVVLDGARWQEVLVGSDPKFAVGDDRDMTAEATMPNLHRMIDEGAVIGAPDHGAAMVASGPNFVSLPGYTEIFSGRTPFGCADNDCPATRQATIADEVRATSTDVAVFSSWAPIARAASMRPSEIVHSTGEVGTGAFRADRATADKGLAYYAEHRPSFFFLGLGEPDEFAHKGDYTGYMGSLRQADAVLGELRRLLAQMGERGRSTSVFVTCDHGRSDNFQDHGWPWPESQRVWLVAAGGAIPARGVVDASRKHRLADIVPTVRVLLDLPPDLSSGAGSPIEELLPSPSR